MTAVAIAVTLGALTWLYAHVRSVDPVEHRLVDLTLRELKGLDRTINQDVLRARFGLSDSYHSLLGSYREVERLEALLAVTPSYLGPVSAREFGLAVDEYRKATTHKQRAIEQFKYGTAELNDLLRYLAGAGEAVGEVLADSGEAEIAKRAHRVVYLALLYNLTSDPRAAPEIQEKVRELAAAGAGSSLYNVRVRVRTFCRNVTRLLEVKSREDQLLRAILSEPIAEHERRVSDVYYSGYSAADARAERYRLLLYGLSVAVLASVVLALLALARSNDRLELRVRTRTRELDERAEELKNVLDHMGQALFTVDPMGCISRERSAKLDQWFPTAVPGLKLWEWLDSIESPDAAWVELGWIQLSDGILPVAVVLDQLPKRMRVHTKHYEVEYRAILDASGCVTQVLVVLSDVTQAVAAQREREAQQEQLVVFQHYLRDRRAFLEFVSTGNDAIVALTDPRVERADLFRSVHTLKGNCSLFGVESVARVCQALEVELAAEEEPSEAARGRMTRAWDDFKERLTSTTGAGESANVVQFNVVAIAQLKRAIAAKQSAPQLLAALDRMQREPVDGRLFRLAEHARTIAQQLGKGNVRVSTEDGGVRLDTQRWAPFWAAAVHVLRNAADHGLETPVDRRESGKPERGRLCLRTRYSGASVVIEFEDDGRGVDWEAIRAKAQERGTEVFSEEELQSLLFQGGLSTREQLTDFSGCGIGLSAAYRACDQLGGRAEIDSVRGEGTTIRFVIPDDDAVTSIREQRTSLPA